jgi:hypothetical protein
MKRYAIEFVLEDAEGHRGDVNGLSWADSEVEARRTVIHQSGQVGCRVLRFVGVKRMQVTQPPRES